MIDVLFINAITELSINQEVNGTMLLATKLLQAGYRADILRFCQVEGYRKDYPKFIRSITDRILEMEPKCVSFYTLWPYYHIMLRIARELKHRRSDLHIIFGGPQSSATAEETMKTQEFVDFICTGEGEDTVVPFFRTLLEEDGANLAAIPSLYYRRDGQIRFNDSTVPLCDLNALPYWDDRLYVKEYLSDPELTSDTLFMPIDAGRGCPYSCSFCCSSYFWKRTYRLKSPDRIVADILHYNQKFGIRSFWFSHDAFTTNQRLVSQVCDRILEAGLDIKWRCSARVDCLSEELVLKMKKSGMTQIELGIETGSPRMQKLINKNLNLEKARSMISFLLKHRIQVNLFFIYGFPEETEQDLNETLELMFSLLDQGVSQAGLFFCKFNPTTQITEEYFDQLVFDPEIKILSRGVMFGFADEMEMFREHKALFPFFYHLPTQIRNDYQYLFFLAFLYQQFPGSIRYLRKLYKGDNLKFYRDFYSSNLEYFQQDMIHTTKGVYYKPVEMVENLLKKFDLPYARQLAALMRFDYDAHQVLEHNGDTAIRKTYDFNYIDFSLKNPIEAYCEGKTEILLEKKNGKMNMQVLSIT